MKPLSHNNTIKKLKDNEAIKSEEQIKKKKMIVRC